MIARGTEPEATIRIPGLNLASGNESQVDNLNEQLRVWVHDEDDRGKSSRARNRGSTSSKDKGEVQNRPGKNDSIIVSSSEHGRKSRLYSKTQVPSASCAPQRSRHATEVLKQVETIDVSQTKAYYDQLPISPGTDLFRLLGPSCAESEGGFRLGKNKVGISRKENKLPRNQQDGFLHVPIAETVIFSADNKRRLLYFNERKGLVESKSVDDVKAKRLVESWQSNTDRPFCAVEKVGSWQSPAKSETHVVLKPTLGKHLEKGGTKRLIQKFVQSKGSKAAVYRAKWRRDKPFAWLNIISNSSVSESLNLASIDVTYETTAAMSRADAARATKSHANSPQTTQQNQQEKQEQQHEQALDSSLASPFIGHAGDLSTCDAKGVFMTQGRDGHAHGDVSNNNGSLEGGDNASAPAMAYADDVAQSTPKREEDGLLGEFFKAEKEISAGLCPSISSPDQVSVFRISNTNSQVAELLTRVIRHLERRIRHMYSFSCFGFEALACDFVKTDQGTFVLVGIKGFELTKAAFKEAAQLVRDLEEMQAAKGEFYDSDEEESYFQARREARREQICAATASSCPTNKVFATSTHKRCCLCDRYFELGAQFKSKRDNSEVTNAESGSDGSDSYREQPSPECGSTENTNSIAQKGKAKRKDLEDKGKEIFEGKRKDFEEALAAIRANGEASSTKTRSRAPIEVCREFADKLYTVKDPPPRAFELTEVMARSLRTQLALRGHSIAAYSSTTSEGSAQFGGRVGGRLRTGSDIFQTCELCFEL